MAKGKDTSSSHYLSTYDLARTLYILSAEYKTTLPALIKKLDSVSGNLNDLALMMGGNKHVEWNAD